MRSSFSIEVLWSLFLCLGVILGATGQTLEWERNYGGANNDEGFAVKYTDDGGSIVIGASSSNAYDLSNNEGGDDLWALKLDSSGNIQWSKSYGGFGNEIGRSVQQTEDGGFIVAASHPTYEDDSLASNGAQDYWILKLDSVGNIVWQRVYGGSESDIPHDLRITKDGGFIVAGTTRSNDSTVSNNHGGDDYWVIKLDSLGYLEWESNYGGPNDDECYSVRETDNGGFMILGENTTAGDDVSNNYGSIDLWVVKVDSTGSILWEQNYGGSGGDWAYSMDKTEKGNYLIAAGSGSNDIDVPANYGEYDAFILKIDPTGIIQWASNFGGSGWDLPASIKSTGNGGSITLVRTGSDDWDISDFNGGDDYWGLKLDSSGSIEWEETYGGPGLDIPNAIDTKGDQHYIGTGKTDQAGGDVSDHYAENDNWVIDLCKVSRDSISVNACPPYTVPSGDRNYVSSGQYKDTLTNSIGCDSVIHIDLSIDTSSAFLSPSSCSSYTVPSGDTTLSSTGTYIDTLTNSDGCDSLITIDLSVDTTSSSMSVSACHEYTVPSGDTTYSGSGVYTDTLTNSMGCDSILTIDLKIEDSSSHSVKRTACDSFLAPSGDTVFSSTGIHTDTLVNAAGCDSILNIDLTVFQSDSTSISDTACFSYTTPSGDSTLTSSGIYSDTLQNSKGCDSVLSIDLTIGTPDTGLKVHNDTLWTVSGNAPFQWFRCQPNSSSITGASTKDLFPPSNGTYSFETGDNGCRDTTLCLTSLPSSKWNAFSEGKDYRITDVHPLDSNKGWSTGTDGRIRATLDGGKSWSTVMDTNKAMHAVQFHGPDTGYAVGADGSFFRTTNGGNNWSYQTLASGKALHDQHFLDASRGWACGDSGTILFTSDGGSSWTTQSSSTNKDLRGIHFQNVDTGLCVGKGGTVLLTEDGGASWNQAGPSFPEDLKDVRWLSDTSALTVGANGTILRTKDLSSTWVGEFSGSFATLNAIHSTDSSGIWVVGDDGTILRSGDQAVNWTSEVERSFHDLESVHFVNDRYGWAVGNNATVLRKRASFTSDTSGVRPISKGEQGRIKVFPNPAEGQVVIEHAFLRREALKVTLRSIRGRVVKQRTFQAVGDGRSILDLKGVADGIYFLDLRWRRDGAPQRSTEKLIVQ